MKNGTSGVLAVVGDNDYPYAVPLSYVYHENKIFFHCAKTGHKLDAVARNEKVSFCVIDQDNIVQEEYTTYFKSVIVFGKVRIIDNDDEKYRAINILAARYAPDYKQGYLKEIDKHLKQVCLMELLIEHISGKQAIELIK